MLTKGSLTLRQIERLEGLQRDTKLCGDALYEAFDRMQSKEPGTLPLSAQPVAFLCTHCGFQTIPEELDRTGYVYVVSYLCTGCMVVEHFRCEGEGEQ